MYQRNPWMPFTHRVSAWATLIAAMLFAATIRADTPIYPNLGAQLAEQGALVLDVRAPDEVAETGLLADARNIEHTDTQAVKEAIGEDPYRTVVVYCASGRRAGLAIESLQEAGFRSLVNAGGYEDLRTALGD